jgi:anti-sigma regulatory factor (Ser/Thr protein kinase)
VCFVPMEEAGRNPARLMTAWADFLAARSSSPSSPAGVRGIGEPIWPGRLADQIDEVLRHEALLNLAFRGTDGLRLRCPYDAVGLDPSVLQQARHDHPWLHTSEGTGPSPSFRPEVDSWLEGSLPAPPPAAAELAFDRSNLSAVRHHAAGVARDAGCASSQVDDVVLAVSEAITNSIRHGGGRGVARFWTADGSLFCEVCDTGCIADPLAGRLRPAADQLQGRGLWLIQQVCDLVQVRCNPDGQVVRLRFDR